MTNESISARKEYYKKYREDHKKRLNEQQRIWRNNNPDKTKQYQERYWTKQSETNIEMEA